MKRLRRGCGCHCLQLLARQRGWRRGGRVAAARMALQEKGSNFSWNIISPPSLHDISCPPYRPAAAGVPGFLHGTPIASHIHAGARRAKQRGGWGPEVFFWCAKQRCWLASASWQWKFHEVKWTPISVSLCCYFTLARTGRFGAAAQRLTDHVI